MKLQRVQRHGASAITLSCVRCAGRFREVELLADLDGPAFAAYYCQSCADVVAPGQVNDYVITAKHADVR